jgi:hypothetical protein
MFRDRTLSLSGAPDCGEFVDLPGGETDDIGQVRVESEGLVALQNDGTFNGDQPFAPWTEEDFCMTTTLGLSAVYGDDNSWNEQSQAYDESAGQFVPRTARLSVDRPPIAVRVRPLPGTS